jgi:predicted Fe-Mo cluster-binding NifX family protein
LHKEARAVMRAAFAVWNDRIAPVFDVTRHIHLVETEARRIVSERVEALPDDDGSGKALRLVELGVDMLVCGAISRSMHVMVSAYGIRTVPFVAGDLREIVNAWLSGELEKRVFAMPGCCAVGRGAGRRVRAAGQEVHAMNGGGRGGAGMGGGQGRGDQGRGGGGQGRGGGKGRGQGRGLGRMGGPKADGPAGECVCSACGHREPHMRGIPCTQRQCPKCGAAMIRE